MSMSTDRPNLGRSAKTACWALLVLLLAVNVAVRWHCLSVPLDRDEGEFAYGGQLLLAGDLPYRSLYAMKLPGIYAVYAAIEAFAGQSAEGIHWGLLVVSTWNIVWVFLLGRDLTDELGGLLAAIAYLALSLSRVVHPTAAQAEIFVLMLVLPGIWLLLRPGEGWQRSIPWLLSGLCFGGALVIKQHGATFGFVAIAYLLTGQWSDRRMAWRLWGALTGAFCAGFAIPYAATVAWFAYRDAFEPFWFWTVTYPRQYVALTPKGAILQRFLNMLLHQISPLFIIWMISAIGIVMWVRNVWRGVQASWCLWFTLASLLAIVPGWYFRHHYFLFLLPFVALAASYALRSVVDIDRRPAAILTVSGIWIVILAIALATQASFLVARSPDEISVAIYGRSPFTDSLRITEQIAKESRPEESIAILGSEPQIPFYAQRRSATGHVYMYPLMESQAYAVKMQEQAIREIEEQRPRMLVWVHCRYSWLRTEESATLIFDWAEKYLSQYEPLMLIDIGEEVGSFVIEGAEAASYRPLGATWMILYRRLDDPSDVP